MVDIKGELKGMADREQWAARGASFVAKAKATKVVWFPPKPAEAGKKTASTAKKATKKTARKTSGAAKRTSGAAKGTTTKSAKKVSSPVRRKKT